MLFGKMYLSVISGGYNVQQAIIRQRVLNSEQTVGSLYKKVEQQLDKEQKVPDHKNLECTHFFISI